MALLGCVKELTAAGIAFNCPYFLHQRLEQMMVQNIIIPATKWITELYRKKVL